MTQLIICGIETGHRLISRRELSIHNFHIDGVTGKGVTGSNNSNLTDQQIAFIYCDIAHYSYN